MVDVSDKIKTLRTAKARASVYLPAPAMIALRNQDLQKKGSPLQVAIIGGIMAAKQTSNLIPLCHHIPLNKVDVDVKVEEHLVHVDCSVSAFYHTGVEMEALVGASIAACIVYDMLKASSHGIIIQTIKLMAKTGGKQDYNEDQTLK